MGGGGLAQDGGTTQIEIIQRHQIWGSNIRFGTLEQHEMGNQKFVIRSKWIKVACFVIKSEGTGAALQDY